MERVEFAGKTHNKSERDGEKKHENRRYENTRPLSNRQKNRIRGGRKSGKLG